MQVDCFISLCLWPRERSKSERRGRCSCSVMCWLSAALCQLGAAGFSRRIKPSHGFHSLRTGSCGQGNIYIHSFWPLGSKAQITKSPIVQKLHQGLEVGILSVVIEMDMTRYEVFLYYTCFSWLLASNYPIPWYPIKTFPTGFLHIDKGNSLKIQPEICKQDWQGAHGIPEITMAGSVDWKSKNLSQLFFHCLPLL